MESTAPAAPLRQTLTLVNDFVISTSEFLSRFAARCEDRLDALSLHVARLETEAALLEKKLNSVPGLAAAGAEVPDVGAGQGASQAPASAQNPPNGAAAPAPAPAPAAPVDPAYEKYFKLIRLGMPMEHVQLKMESEGFDPSVLEGGGGGASAPASAPAPAPAAPAGQQAAPPAAAAPAGEAPPAGGEAAPGGEEGAAAADVMKVKDDPMYAKFFKMINFGVPLPAAKIKMQAEGVDPSVLDMDPEAPSPNAGSLTAT